MASGSCGVQISRAEWRRERVVVYHARRSWSLPKCTGCLRFFIDLVVLKMDRVDHDVELLLLEVSVLRRTVKQPRFRAADQMILGGAGTKAATNQGCPLPSNGTSPRSCRTIAQRERGEGASPMPEM